MDLKQLTSLVTVAEQGSITKAAQVLHFVQPAITRQIQLLEEEMGTQLFRRSRLGMELTPAGEVLVEHTRRALSELAQATAEIRPTPDAVAGVVSVGVLESCLDLVVEPLVSAVSARLPNVELRLLTAYSGQLQSWLDKGDIDLSLLYNLAETPALSVTPLIDEELWAVAPASEGLSPDRPVTCEEAMSRTLVLPVPGHGLRVLIDRAAEAAGVELRPGIEVNALRLQKALVVGGHGWTVLPAIGVAADVRVGILSGAPLASPAVVREVVLGRSRVRHVPPPSEAVAIELTRTVRQLVADEAWPGAVPIATP